MEEIPRRPQSRPGLNPRDALDILDIRTRREQQLGAGSTALAGRTARPIMVYNIPYRTGVNMLNDTLLRLAKLPNIIGLKDCCADQTQSFDLLRARPAGFAVLTGEDTLFHAALTQGLLDEVLAREEGAGRGDLGSAGHRFFAGCEGAADGSALPRLALSSAREPAVVSR